MSNENSFVVVVIDSQGEVHMHAQWECEGNARREAAREVARLIEELGTTDVEIEVRFFRA
jgi:hypothetical protein